MNRNIRKHAPDNETPFLVLGVRKLKQAVSTDWKPDPRGLSVAADAETVDVELAQEANSTSDDERWLDTTIRGVEEAYDSGTLTDRRTTAIHHKLNKLLTRYPNADFSIYKVFELSALLFAAEGEPGSSDQALEEALRYMPGNSEFVSMAATKWLSRRHEQAAPERVTTQDKPQRRRTGKRLAIGVGLVLSFSILFGILDGPIADHFTIADANPVMVKLAQEAEMTREGELLFLRTKPQLVSDTQMTQDCPDLVEGANSSGFIVQGCYAPDQNNPSTGRIYLREMPSDLYNLEVVTAAYEMLHAAYYSISGGATSNAALDQEIESNYSTISNPTATNQVNEFAKTEPGARDLELFSILGTQDYDGLNPTLRNYYAPYLANPGLEVDDNNQIASMFQNDESQLQQLQSTITSDENDANTAYADSVSWANVGNQYENDYNYNIYNEDLDAANTAIDQYNSLLQTYQTLVAEYNGRQFSQIQSVQPQSQ